MQFIDILYLGIFFFILYSSVLWFIVYFKNKNNFTTSNTKKKSYPSITFLVPAYNEEKHIATCINGLLSLDYPTKPKIIVINDGSTDKTVQIVKNYRKEGVVLLTKKNEGKKAKALNYALMKASINTDFVACMDADSYPDKDYLKRIVAYADRADAVTPAMKISNPHTFVQKIQWVEYCFSIFLRKLFSFVDCQYVLPGPGSIYRTSTLKAAGYFDEANLTEDMEIAFRLHNQGYKIENCSDAYVFTDSPETFSGLLSQRLRWYRGYLQNVKKYAHMIFNLKYGNLGFFLLPINFVWIFVLLFLFLYPIGITLQTTVSLFNTLSAIHFNLLKPFFYPSILYIDIYSFFWVLFWILNLVIIYLSIKLSGEEIQLKNRKLHYIGFFVFYPFMLTLFWMLSILSEFFKIKQKW